MNGLDIFSGIGGLSIAISPWVKTVAYCESDRYAQGVLLSRMQSNDIDRAPIWDDVRTLSAQQLPCIDIIHGGFPCQDISVAGHGKGLEGERSGLFFQITRLIDECRPAFIFLENVPAIRTRGGERVGKELASRGYDCRWHVVSAAEVGAPHLRKRWFLLAHSNSSSLRLEQQRMPRGWAQGRSSAAGCGEIVADTNSAGFEHSSEMHTRSERSAGWNSAASSGWWDVEPNVGRVANGVSARVDRLRGLGNAVVPLQAREAFKRLAGLP